MDLAPYRLVRLALWAEASPAENAVLTEHFRTVLAPHGEALVHAHGPYHRTPEMLHFKVDLTPRESASDCLRALGFIWEEDIGWSEWERPVNGGTFLHPAVYGAQADGLEAAAPPRFRTGEVAQVRDSPQARRLGLVGAEVIVGHPDYEEDTAPAQRTWHYSVHVSGQDETEDLAGSDLEPTGRRVPLYGERISVGPDGVVAESSGASRVITS
ncbi:hypothetical protein H0H10_20520 [Streptomyces sp. TRM S81-3]|uniref:Uncharacterized protein n=1 Tax=Streptomyces griseicoloratus TaxID=2752516 RepID=A0A926QS91_9ACTN|nr:hypothetical protein [Streptomyces griseicoloratus]MBD0421510.1 hypothetical protein [Streptomyces griseicoloratus]